MSVARLITSTEKWKPFGLPIREVYIASKKTEIESQQGQKAL